MPSEQPPTREGTRPERWVCRLLTPIQPEPGQIVLLDGHIGRVKSVEHDFDDGTTLEYLDGPHKGHLTMRDTYAVARYPRVQGVASEWRKPAQPEQLRTTESAVGFVHRRLRETRDHA